jgi:hypothetical protein
MKKMLLLILIDFRFLIVNPVATQVAREKGAGSIAGMLDRFSDWSDNFLFKLRGPHILFADLDAEFLNQQDHPP